MSSRKTWRTRRRSGRFSRCDGLGARGVNGMLPRVILPVRALGTRGVPGMLPGVILPVGALGTRGVPGMLPGVILPVRALGTRGAPGEYPGVSRREHSGHVAEERRWRRG